MPPGEAAAALKCVAKSPGEVNQYCLGRLLVVVRDLLHGFARRAYAQAIGFHRIEDGIDVLAKRFGHISRACLHQLAHDRFRTHALVPVVLAKCEERDEQDDRRKQRVHADVR